MFKILFSIIVVFLCGCQGPSKAPPSEGKPFVLVSIAPYAYFVERIAGETVKVSSVVPGGVNMHLYEPTVQELTLAQKAQLWFRIGEPFEARILDVLSAHAPHMKIVELWKNIPLIEGDEAHELCSHYAGEEAKDLHVWTSPKLAAMQCKKIEAALSELLPQHATTYAANLQVLEKDLEKLDQEIQTLLAPYKGNALLVSHPAFGYFCQEYQLVQLSVECSGKDPLPKDVEYILEQAEHYQVRAVFTQLGYNNKGAELIAKKLHLPIFLVDPYSGDYIHNLHHIAELIVK